jgi:hypothetical protein
MPRRRRRSVPALNDLKLDSLRIDSLREAIRANSVSFPSQVPTFERHDRADVQAKLVQLYFVCGWNCESIAGRYGLIQQRVRQILTTWKRRAVETGYIQYIPPDELLILPTRAMSAAPPALNYFPVPLPPPAMANVVSELSTSY